jgi:hypothetical protein
MGKPKTGTTSRRTKTRRSHLVLELARKVNKHSPVKARTTRRETGNKLAEAIKAVTATKVAAPKKTAAPKVATPAKKTAPKKAA